MYITLAETACLPSHVHHQCRQNTDDRHGGACRQLTGSGSLRQALESCWHSVRLRYPTFVSQAGAVCEEFRSTVRLVRTFKQYTIGGEGKFPPMSTCYLIPNPELQLMLILIQKQAEAGVDVIVADRVGLIAKALAEDRHICGSHVAFDWSRASFGWSALGQRAPAIGKIWKASSTNRGCHIEHNLRNHWCEYISRVVW